MEDLLGRAAGEVGTCLEHGVGVRGDVHLGDLGQRLGRGLVLRRAGGGAEHERVGEDRREHEPGDVRGNLDARLLVDAIDDGAGASHGHEPEPHGTARLEAADAVVVDDLHDLGLLESVYRLGALVVVHEDDVLLLDVEHVGRAHEADVVALLVDDGEEAVARLGHDLLGVVDRGVEAELEDVALEHLGTHGDGHADESCRGIGVVRRDDDGAAVTLGGGDHALGHLGAAADDDAAGVALDGELLGLVAVGHEDDVAGEDGVLHHLWRGADPDVALLDAAVGVADDHLAVQGLDDVGVLGLGLRQGAGVEDVHVRVGDVLDGDKADEVLLAVGDAEGVETNLLHEVPCGEEAHLLVDARLVLDLDVLDLRRHRGDEGRLREPEVLEHEGRLAVDGTSATGLVDGLINLVLEVGVGDGRADAVCVRVKVSNDVDLADCLWHAKPLLAFRRQDVHDDASFDHSSKDCCTPAPRGPPPSGEANE